MAGFNRTNMLSLSCSCIGQVTIMGGFLFGFLDHDRQTAGVSPTRPPVVLQLLALDPTANSGTGASARAAGRAVTLTEPPLRHRREPPRRAVASVPIRAIPSADGAGMRDAPEPAEPSLASGPAFSDYQRRLYETLALNSRYPAEARRAHLSGVTLLAFRVDRSGAVLERWIQKSAGSALLDDAAFEALARAQPLPPIPAGLPERLDFVIEMDLSILPQAAPRAAG